jgi:hypothetical protein
VARRTPRTSSFWIEWAQGMAVVTVGVPPTLGIAVFLVSRFAQVASPPPAWSNDPSRLLAAWAVATGVLLAGCAGILYPQLAEEVVGTLHGSELLGFSPFPTLNPAVRRIRDTVFTPVGDATLVSFDLDTSDGRSWTRRPMYFCTLEGPVASVALARARARAPGWTVEVRDDRLLAFPPGEHPADGATRVTDADRLTFLEVASALGGDPA